MYIVQYIIRCVIVVVREQIHTHTRQNELKTDEYYTCYCVYIVYNIYIYIYRQKYNAQFQLLSEPDRTKEK